MRRALVGIPENELKALDALSEIQHVSRAELIRRAVSLYLEKFKPTDSTDVAFGLWEDRKMDGLAYQTRLREEW